MKCEQYEHYGTTVWVRADLKAKHREYCLCWSCAKLQPERNDENCRAADVLYALCRKFGMVLVIWECPDFEFDYPRHIENAHKREG